MDKRLASGSATISLLASAIGNLAQTDGDHTTAISALTLHRRKAPTEPLHCIYSLGLGVVAQGGKTGNAWGRRDRLRPRSMHADDHRSAGRLACHAGQYPRTVSRSDADIGQPPHRAGGLRDGTTTNPEGVHPSSYLDRNARRFPGRRPGPAGRSAARAGTDFPAGAADPAGNHHSPAGGSAWPATAAPRRHWIAEPADREGRRLAQAEFQADATRGRARQPHAYESIHLPTALPRDHRYQPPAVPEAVAAAGGTATDAQPEPRRRQRRGTRRL